jgi:hypothetical protein
VRILLPTIEFRIFFESAPPLTIAPGLSHFSITSRIVGSAIPWGIILRHHSCLMRVKQLSGGGRPQIPMLTGKPIGAAQNLFAEIFSFS